MFVHAQNFKFCETTIDDRIIESSNASSYKNMISKELNSKNSIRSKNCIHSKNELIINSKFGNLSKNYTFTVEVYFEYTLINILKNDFFRSKG